MIKVDRGSGNYPLGGNEERDFTSFSNQKIVLELSGRQILEQLNKIQRADQIKPSENWWETGRMVKSHH